MTPSSEESHLTEQSSSKASESQSSHSAEVSAEEPSTTQSEDPEKSKTSTSDDKCRSKESSNSELSLSAHSLPSSPRRLRRAHSSGVKKLTSEIFSTESDITRSLEIVYKEPAENARRKLSEKYRHVSSNGASASDGSISNESQKIEKRKASVTRLRSRTDSNEQDLGTASGSASGAKSPSPRSSDDEVERPTREAEPVLEKKHPSPTKLKQPVSIQKPELTAEETFSPVLKVVCQTPERSQKHLYKYAEGMSLSKTANAL